MKIGFICERMLKGFGVDLVVDRVARGLADKGHDVTVYASISDDTLGDGAYRLKLIPTPASAFFPRYDLSAQAHLRMLNREDIDLFAVETFPYYSYLPRLEKPAVAVNHGVSSYADFPPRIRANFAYVEFMQQHIYFRFARHIVTVSGYLRSELPSGLRTRTSVIYNGADHYLAGGNGDGAGLRSELGVADGEVLMLYVGRLSPRHQPYKGTAELVKLYRLLRRDRPGLKLLMVGFGSPQDSKWLEREGVLAMANAPAARMPDIFSACDIYVTASRWEGFDLPLVEAQSFGKPVAALDVCAHPEVVRHRKSGFLAADLAGLGAAITLLADDASMRVRMGKAARENAGRFTWERAVSQYEELFRSLIT